MSALLLSKGEQGVVIFHVWKSLEYKIRILLSLFFIAIGLVIQYYNMDLFPGVFFVFAGNLLLLVKGYDNRIKLGGYKHEAEWTKVDKEQFDKIIEFNKKTQKWDISALDITSGRGVLFFILSIIALIIAVASSGFYYDAPILIVIVNVAVLLYPHWFTGIRRITTTPNLIQKIAIYKKVLYSFAQILKEDTIEYLMYVKGKEQKLPDDAKLKIEFKNQPEGFLGMYAQISLNNVQGKHYPYYYVVLVAKKGFGLGNYFNSVKTSHKVIKEQSKQDDVEIIVIRQHTTKTSGYFTKEKAILNITNDGIKAARQILGGISGGGWSS